MHGASASLYAVVVHPGPEGYTVSAWWMLERGDATYGAIVTSDDGFKDAAYERASQSAWARHAPAPKRVSAPSIDVFRGLLTSPVTSLAVGTRAFVAGGDGATLLPFQAVARSTDDAAWQGNVVPRTDGDRAYVEGAVVLPDRRLLALLGAWSSDRGPARPGPEYHGLWVSAGDDWSHYAPYRPTFSPALAQGGPVTSIDAQPGGSRRSAYGLVFATTRDNRLYVSADGAATFGEIRDR